MSRPKAAPWGESGDVAAFLEALYRIDLPEQRWLEQVAAAFEDLTPGSFVLAGTFTWHRGQRGFRPRAMAGSLGFSSRAAETAEQPEPEFIAATMASERRFYVLSEVLGPRLETMAVGTMLGEFGAADALGLQVATPGELCEGVSLGATHAGTIRLSEPGRATWHRVAAHLAAAMRLRAAVGAHPVESVLAPDGRILDAVGHARGQGERAALTRAVRAIDRARACYARTDPTAVLEAWRAIVEGRWTLVEVVESDGRRFMMARVNPPVAVADEAFTRRERQVVTLLKHGVPQKAVGYELSMSPSTVSFHVKNIARKVGATSRVELVRMLSEGALKPLLKADGTPDAAARRSASASADR